LVVIANEVAGVAEPHPLSAWAIVTDPAVRRLAKARAVIALADIAAVKVAPIVCAPWCLAESLAIPVEITTFPTQDPIAGGPAVIRRIAGPTMAVVRHISEARFVAAVAAVATRVDLAYAQASIIAVSSTMAARLTYTIAKARFVVAVPALRAGFGLDVPLSFPTACHLAFMRTCAELSHLAPVTAPAAPATVAGLVPLHGPAAAEAAVGATPIAASARNALAAATGTAPTATGLMTLHMPAALRITTTSAVTALPTAAIAVWIAAAAGLAVTVSSQYWSG